MRYLFEPGLFSSSPALHALFLSAVVAAVSAVVGVYVILRSNSFSGHALTDVATTGGAGAAFVGFAPLVGFIGGALAGAGAIEVVGRDNAQHRDTATGLVLGAATGLSALFLYLTATNSTTTGVTQQVLFGSIFSVSTATIPVAALLAILIVGVMGLIARPLTLASLSPDIASAHGVPSRRLGVIFLVCTSVSVGLSAITLGSVLSTALIIGPAATALRLSKNIWRATLASVAIGIGACWAGIVIAYDSYYWHRSSQELPVSCCVVAVIVAFYGASSALRRLRSRHV